MLRLFSALKNILSWFQKASVTPPVVPVEPPKPPQIEPVVIEKPIVRDTAWRGGELKDRLAMYDLATKVCMEEKLSLSMTRDLLATIMGESGFNQWCENHKNKNGSADWGICQFNDDTNAKGVPFWIGKGAAFKDVNEVLTNPEKCIRVMAKEFKKGHQKWWYAYPHRSKHYDTKPR